MTPSTPPRAPQPLSRSHRRWVRLLLVAFATVAAVLAGPGAASAENSLVSSDPADNASLATSPTSMQFSFAEPLGATNTVVVTCNGTPFSVGNPSVGPDGRSLTVPVPNPMPKGTCNVVVFVSAPDATANGQVSIGFTITADTETVVVGSSAPVATAAPATGDGADSTADSGSTAVGSSSSAAGDGLGGVLGLARLIANLGLAALLGALVLIAVAWPEGVEYILTVRFLRTAWAVAAAGTVLTAVVLTAQATDASLGSSLSPLAWRELTATGPGFAALARVALTLATVWVVMRPERVLDPGTQLPALALPALAVATLGLTRTGGDLAIIGGIVGIAHALAVSVWFGGIVLLTRVVLAGPGDDDLVHAVRGHHRLAGPALVITVLTGAVQTFRLDGGALLTSGHGRVLVLKALAVGGMVFVGLATRQFAAAQLRTADELSGVTAGRLRRATGVEAIGGVLVLALTSWLLSFSPPNLASADTVDQYAYTQGRVVTEDLDVTVMLTGVVGRNGVRVEVDEPATGLSALTVTFIPPAGSDAPTVVLTLPSELSGRGVAVLDVAEGVPLSAPGVWTMAVRATTATGEQTGQKRFTLLGG